MKKTHIYQLLLGLSLIGLIFLSACGGDAAQKDAAIKAEVEQLETASEEMSKMKDDIESSKEEVDAAMKEVDEILDGNN